MGLISSTEPPKPETKGSDGKYHVPEETITFLIEDTSLPVYFIKAIHKLFEDCCDGRGHMDKNKFMELFRGRIELSGDLKDFLISLYKAFDEDENTFIDFKEMVQMLNILLCGEQLERLGGIFRICDRNGDGVITKEELSSIMLSLAPFRPGKTVDIRRASLKKLADTMFKKFDADGDGMITKVEFLKGAREDKEMLSEMDAVIKICVGQGL